MSSVRYFLLLLVVTLCKCSRIKIDHFELCDKGKQPITFDIKIKNDGDKQILEYGVLDTKIDINNDITNKITLYRYVEHDWQPLISKIDLVCTIITNALGEFAENLEKSAGMTQRCPYPKGKHEVKNYPLDFSRLKYKDFPAGKNKIRSEFFPKGEEKRIGCYDLEFSVEK